MNPTFAKSKTAIEALSLVRHLQSRFAELLNEGIEGPAFTDVSWLRADGKFGGGTRLVANQPEWFNRASINVSQVQYESDPDKKLNSATAISTIIHPDNPVAPSVHIHISWTEMKTGNGYWRIMGDLNPSIPSEEAVSKFDKMLREATGDHYEKGRQQGEKYFYIPALGRHRGMSHFYLEGFYTGDFDKDLATAGAMGDAFISCYADIFHSHRSRPSNEENSIMQLDYHTLYFFQVLTLDRGTTAGLMIHDENDIGIMGSLPSHINRDLLQSWTKVTPDPFKELVESFLKDLPEAQVAPVEEDTKQKLAESIRRFYKEHPEALDLQASGNSTPPTVDNHR